MKVKKLMKNLGRCVRGEEGQGLSEYAFILVFVAVACVLAAVALGLAMPGPFNDVTSAL